MKEKKRVYEALVDGAMEGLSDKALYDFVLSRCPKATSRKIVRASLFALTDPHLKDRNILDTIYALAIKHRLDPGVLDDEGSDGDDGICAETAANQNVPDIAR
jgi:hypothetical protein